MNKINKMILAGMVLAAGLAGKAQASIAVSTMSVAGVVAAPAPADPTKLIRIKGCNFSNAGIPALGQCANLLDGTTLKLVLCAPPQQTQAFPAGSTGVGNALAGTPGAISQFFGEDLTMVGPFNVTSSTPSATSLLTCSFQVK